MQDALPRLSIARRRIPKPGRHETEHRDHGLKKTKPLEHRAPRMSGTQRRRSPTTRKTVPRLPPIDQLSTHPEAEPPAMSGGPTS